MSFQLSNEDGFSTSSSTNDSPLKTSNYTNTAPATERDDFDPAAENTVFIANRYNTSESASDTSNASTYYLTEKETFPPILMIIGAALRILCMFSMLNSLRNLDISDPSSGFLGSIFPLMILSLVGSVLYLVDAIILYKKKIAKGSLIAWAYFLPVVYFFKRCSANGDSFLIALITTILLFATEIYYSYSGVNVAFEAAGIEINDTGLAGATLANDRANTLSYYYIAIDYSGTYYYYDDIINYNITDPTYQYVEQTGSGSKLFVVTGTTTIRGSEEPITMNFDYTSMSIQNVIIGTTTYSSDEDIYDVFYAMVHNIPSSASR